MKLNFKDVEIERSSAFATQNFDIGDKRIILEILRGKMYSNPIQTICQEISTNARDAHSEVGKKDVPIEIKLPNKLEPSFYIRDFGPGITPDRMGEVFIQYGRSTKRNTNEQDGSYGLGSKSPFSYSDTFTIISITPENEQLVRREYLAHIDESGLGQMSCVKTEVTEELQGTTILLYPKETDWQSFTNFVKRATAYWNVKPTILGDSSFEWPKYNISCQGSDWEIHDSASLLEAVPYALINGIPYKINIRHLYIAGNAQIADLPLRLHFKTGEVPVTANREEIDYQSNVIDHVKNRLTKAIEELKEVLASTLKNAKSLRAAIVLWQDLKKKTYGKLLTQYTWNKIDLQQFETIRLTGIDGIVVNHFRRDSNAILRCRKTDQSPNLHVNASTVLVEDDTKMKGIPRTRLATLFLNNPHIQYVELIDLTKKVDNLKTNTGEIIPKVSIADDAVITTRKAALEKSYHYSSLDPIKLSTIPKMPLPQSEKKAAERVKVSKVKKLVIDTAGSCGWADADFDALNDDGKNKLYIKVANKTVYLSEEVRLSITDDVSKFIGLMNTMIAALHTDTTTKPPQLEIYGVVPSHVTKLNSTWKPLLAFADKLRLQYQKILPEQFGSDYAISRRFYGQIAILLTHPEFLALLTAGSPLITYIEESKNINSAASMIGTYNDTLSYIGKRAEEIRSQPKNQKALKALYDEVISRYPLIVGLDVHNNEKQFRENLAIYINAKEELLQKEQAAKQTANTDPTVDTQS